MISENLFTDLDAEDKGKISKGEIRNALVLMGVEMGVPPFSGLLQQFQVIIILWFVDNIERISFLKLVFVMNFALVD